MNASKRYQKSGPDNVPGPDLHDPSVEPARCGSGVGYYWVKYESVSATGRARQYGVAVTESPFRWKVLRDRLESLRCRKLREDARERIAREHPGEDARGYGDVLSLMTPTPVRIIDYRRIDAEEFQDAKLADLSSSCSELRAAIDEMMPQERPYR